VSIKAIADAWKADLKTFPSDERVYLDSRKEIYPPFGSDLTYTLVSSTPTQPGSHNLTGGNAYYMLELTDPVTVRARVYPNFAYNIGSNQNIWSWYIDATHRLDLRYADDTAQHRYIVGWIDGGSERWLYGPQYSDNSHQAWTDIDVVIDFANSQATLYIDRVAVDPSWSGSPDAKGMNYPLLEIRSFAGSEGDYKINHVRVFPSLEATATQVANDYKDVKNEEIIWHFNGEGCGRTRCNITRFVAGIYSNKQIEDPVTAQQGANELRLQLFNKAGEFSDDQYAAFDPTADAFNGLVTQKYLQERCRIEAETWYSNSYELFFTGLLDENRFKRRTPADTDGISRVDLNAEDMISIIGRKFKRSAQAFEDKKLSDATEANSLIHLITRLATKDDIYNFASNSSFENDTIGNSWLLGGTSSSKALTRESGGLFGSYEAQLVNGDSPNNAFAYQTVTFTGIKKLNVGETYTFFIWLKCADACSYIIHLAERDSSVQTGSSQTTYIISGGEGWDLWAVSHTIIDSTSDRLRMYIRIDDDVTLSMDGAMLIQNDRAINWFILNNNDGVDGVESADDADSDSYDTIGFDCDAVNVTHPWALVPRDTPIWDHLKDLGDACGNMYLGLDECGTLKLRAKLKTGYSDPSSLETITAVRSIETNIVAAQANKLVGHGVMIKKLTNVVAMWMAEAEGAFDKATGSSKMISEEVANGAYWPDDQPAGDPRGETWAMYGKVT